MTLSADTNSSGTASVIVSLRDVGRVFGEGIVALDRLNLGVREGEFVTLLGPSGCGKSTALRIIAGLLEPSDGSIAWSDDQRPKRGDIGFVFQEPTLMPWQNVTGNVALPLDLSGQPRAETASRVGTVLDQVGLSEFAARYPRELSGGMKMRASIARALVTAPRLLLMDEPFAALDEITRFRLNNDLLSLWHDMRKTFVFVTHSVFESVYLSSRIVVMTARPGRVFTEIEIDAPYPRGDFRTSTAYAAYCRKVSDALERAMQAREAP